MPEETNAPGHARQGMAYSVDIGRLREEFCIGYLRRKQDTFLRIQREIFPKVEAAGKTITCRKGCSVCCVLYVEANIQECEAIAYYLSLKPERLSIFYRQYDAWRDAMRRRGDPFKRCEQILHHHRCEKLQQSDREVLLDALRRYHEQDIPCPFLHMGECIIYEARPYSCCNHYVTTPSEWCRTSNWCDPAFPNKPEIHMTTVDEIDDLSFYCGDLKKPVIGFMPSLVFGILTGGFEYVMEIVDIQPPVPRSEDGHGASAHKA